jgi:hypothetical protein
MAAWTWLFERATTAKPMLRARQPHTNPELQPAESVRTRTSRRTREASSPGRWPAAMSAGSWQTAASSTARWSTTVVVPALPGRRRAARTSPVASAVHSMGLNPKPPL